MGTIIAVGWLLVMLVNRYSSTKLKKAYQDNTDFGIHLRRLINGR